jgi:hypothetical protein
MAIRYYLLSTLSTFYIFPFPLVKLTPVTHMQTHLSFFFPRFIRMGQSLRWGWETVSYPHSFSSSSPPPHPQTSSQYVRPAGEGGQVPGGQREQGRRGGGGPRGPGWRPIVRLLIIRHSLVARIIILR